MCLASAKLFSTNSVVDSSILTSGQLEINKNLIIDGANAPGLTISGNNSYRVFDVNIDPSFNPTTVTLRNLAIANGQSSGFNNRATWRDIRRDAGYIVEFE